MRICFVAFGYENLGVEYLSACLKNEGHEVSLAFDPGLFNTYHLRNSYLSRVFDSTSRIINKIIGSEPDIVAFSVLSDNYLWACDIAKKLKEIRKDLVIVFGGMHPTSVPEIVIRESFVDYVCIGEGEGALADLARSLEYNVDTTGILNLWTKKQGIVFRNSPRDLVDEMDRLPMPDKELFNSEYPGFTRGIYMTMTSKGCPYKCTYCCNNVLMEIYKGKGKYLRRFSVNRVINELEIAKKKFNIKRIVFVDDVFTSDEMWLTDFVLQYKKKINLPFGCLVHPLYVNERIVSLLKECGCTVVGMGIQTLNEDIKHKIIYRKEDNIAVEKAVALFKKAGIVIYVDFIFGLPGQTQKDIEQIALFLCKVRPDSVATLWLRCYPKAEIIRICKEMNLLSDEDIENINNGKDNAPSSDFGNTKIKINKKLVTFVLFSADMPAFLVRLFLRLRLYNLLPEHNFHHPHTLMKHMYNRLRRKQGYLYSSSGTLLKYYFEYAKRHLYYNLEKR